MHISVRGELGKVTFEVLGELSPSNVRGVDTELLTGILTMSVFIVGKIFPLVERIIGLYTLGWFFASVGYGLIIFVYFCYQNVMNLHWNI